MPTKEISAWLGLYLIPGLGNGAFRRLIDVFKTPEAVFKAPAAEIVRHGRIKQQVAQHIKNKRYFSDPEKELLRAEKSHVKIVTFEDPDYPPLLKEIHSPPMVLYVKGRDIPKNQTLIGVVGSRLPSHYGRKAAQVFGLGLARRGTGVVSGMAKGIDSAAHDGCLQGKGYTAAVIGTGIDVIYPSENKELSDRIASDGSIVTEFPFGSPPEPRNFPIRNRIISGLSRGVVVVEATKKSGSLITAAIALDQGRDVFAVPGSIESFKSTGSHLLIKQGAKLVENADDILSEFGFFDKPVQENYLLEEISEAIPELNDGEKKLYDILSDYPLHIDEIVRLGRMNVGEVSGILMGLELKGLARQLMGKRFVK